jgi:hypothetical protein
MLVIVVAVVQFWAIGFDHRAIAPESFVSVHSAVGEKCHPTVFFFLAVPSGSTARRYPQNPRLDKKKHGYV